MSDKKDSCESEDCSCCQNDLKIRSGKLTGIKGCDGWIKRAPARGMMRAVGFTDQDFAKPLITVACPFTNITPCNAHLRELGDLISADVEKIGGTQIKAKIVDKVGYSKYVYNLNGEKIFKIVTYFLMEYVSGSPEDHDWEMEEAGWYEPEAALKQLTFSQDKELLKKALELRNG